jgi:3-oxoacyl-[acyl-carrier-protein] synthase-3
MKQLVNSAKIIGTSSYVPSTIYTNEFLVESVETDAKWLEDHLGIKERRIASPSQATSDLAVEAALKSNGRCKNL